MDSGEAPRGWCRRRCQSRLPVVRKVRGHEEQMYRPSIPALLRGLLIPADPAVARYCPLGLPPLTPQRGHAWLSRSAAATTESGGRRRDLRRRRHHTPSTPPVAPTTSATPTSAATATTAAADAPLQQPDTERGQAEETMVFGTVITVPWLEQLFRTRAVSSCRRRHGGDGCDRARPPQPWPCRAAAAAATDTVIASRGYGSRPGSQQPPLLDLRRRCHPHLCRHRTAGYNTTGSHPTSR